VRITRWRCVLPSSFLYILSFLIQYSSCISFWRGNLQGAGCSSLHIEQGHTHDPHLRFMDCSIRTNISTASCDPVLL
jgi:hypothetical protein